MARVTGTGSNPQIKRKGRRNWPEGVHEVAQRLYNLDPEPTWTEMHRELQRTFGKYDAPGESTLRDWKNRGLISKDEQDVPWSFSEGAPDDVALVLPILRGYLIAQATLLDDLQTIRGDIPFEFRRKSLTRRIARWIVRIRKAAPDLPVGMAWVLAQRAQTAEMAATRMSPTPREDVVEQIQTVLALARWRDDGALLGKAIEAGLLPEDIAGILEPDSSFRASVIDFEVKA